MTVQSTPVAERSNPVHGFAGAALRAVDRIAGSPAWAMSSAEQAETLVELTRLQARVTQLTWRVLAAAERDEIGADTAMSTAGWLARSTRQTRVRANAAVRGGLLLDEAGYTPTREAFAAGELTEDQVWVILRALEDLPADEVTSADRERAQRHLIGLAADHDAKQLRVLASRLFEVLAPEEADKREGEALERQERRARERCRFAVRDNGDGTASGWFTLPCLQADMLTKAVQAFAAPRRTEPTAWRDEDGKKRPYANLLGLGFAELVEHLPVDKLPQAGGAAATIVVTMTLDALKSGLGAAALDTGTPISASEARRLACTAGLVPAVLGTGSVPLDLGRAARLHTAHQRAAMALRDKGCSTEGCDRPPSWTEAHHDIAWTDGGDTSLRNGRLLCPRHHRLAHDTGYDMRRLPNGQVRFHKRT
jgi:hypothetical protein